MNKVILYLLINLLGACAHTPHDGRVKVREKPREDVPCDHLGVFKTTRIFPWIFVGARNKTFSKAANAGATDVSQIQSKRNFFREKFEASAERCPSREYEEEQSLTMACRKEIKTYGSIETCKYAKRNPEEYECKVNKHKYGSIENCKWVQENPIDGKFCTEMMGHFKTYEKCRWALAHPIESKCEIESAKHGGGYWECIKIEREAFDRALALQQQERHHNVDANIAKERLEILRQEQLRQAWRDAFPPQRRTTCTTTTYGGVQNTECYGH